MTTNSYRHRMLKAVAASLLVCSPGAFAADQTWDGGSAGTNTAWLTAANWVGDTAYAGVIGSSGNTDIATIAAGTATTVAINMNTAGGNFSLGAIDWNRALGAALVNNSGTASGVLRLNGATVSSVANTLVRLTGATDLTIGGANALGLALGNANGIFFVDSGRKLTFHANLVVSSVASGNGFTKSGAGELVINGANTYDGATTIDEGRITISNNSALGTGTVTLNGTGAQLQLSAGVSASNSLVVADSGDTKSLRYFSNGSTAATWSGSITINETTNNNFTVNVGNNATDILTISGAVSGVGGIQKLSAGTLVLTGANSYAGTTQINNGTLLVNGNQAAATGAVTVNGGTLGGTGTVGGTVDVNSGGILAAGDNGVGKLSITGKLTLNAGSIFKWELGADTTSGRGTNYDAVDITANPGLDISGSAIFQVVQTGTTDFSTAFWDTNRSWGDIFSASGSSSGWSNTSVLVYNTSGVEQDVSAQGYFTITSRTLQWTAVPEPTSALGGLLLGAGMLRRRRQRL